MKGQEWRIAVSLILTVICVSHRKLLIENQTVICFKICLNENIHGFVSNKGAIVTSCLDEEEELK
jgi:hypothetical protein